jgi:HD superfamily phosphohydrolase
MPIHFSDILYGRIELPDWLDSFIRIPEFLRLRGVRLSNVDSIEFKDFSGPNRWEHSIGVAYLAYLFCEKSGMDSTNSTHLILAALLHDIATPPFAHTVEHVLENFDHEQEAENILFGLDFPVFASQVPQFLNACDFTAKKFGISIDPRKIVELITGNSDNKYSYLINGSVDLDNADNVTRACTHMGIAVDREVPKKIVEWLSSCREIPLDLNLVENHAVSTWLSYRKLLYQAFFRSSEIELGRQAFLQHIIRRAIDLGLSRNALIFNTDERLLVMLERFGDPELRDLVERYRLLEYTHKIIEIEFFDKAALNVLQSPLAAGWIEKYLCTNDFSPFVIVNARRFDNESNETLFESAVGSLQVYKIGSKKLNISQLSGNLKSLIESENSKSRLMERINNSMNKLSRKWISEKPWLTFTRDRKERIVNNLDSVGNWGFHLSRNESIHPFPSTFVHAIPHALISALGLQGGTVLDPFGGTGSTAVAALSHGTFAISFDANRIANLISKTRLTYLNAAKRAALTKLDVSDFSSVFPTKSPEIPDADKWHHPATFEELCKIFTYIENTDDIVIKQFLMTAFSAFLTNTTARSGLQHGFFADNTPLSKNQLTPPYKPAFQLFVQRVRRNVNIIERMYANLDRRGIDTEQALSNTLVKYADARYLSIEGIDINQNVDAIVTSPPYLCMTDYTLGQRLSYYWLFREQMTPDFQAEIGSRRSRFATQKALDEYIRDMHLFANSASNVLKPGGFLATVVGQPLAAKYADKEILLQLSQIFSEYGFKEIWSIMRPIYWHRNHGYARLKQEKISVYTLEK